MDFNAAEGRVVDPETEPLPDGLKTVIADLKPKEVRVIDYPTDLMFDGRCFLPEDIGEDSTNTYIVFRQGLDFDAEITVNNGASVEILVKNNSQAVAWAAYYDHTAQAVYAVRVP